MITITIIIILTIIINKPKLPPPPPPAAAPPPSPPQTPALLGTWLLTMVAQPACCSVSAQVVSFAGMPDSELHHIT